MTLALEGGEWLASHPGRFTPGKRAPSTTGKEAGQNIYF